MVTMAEYIRYQIIKFSAPEDSLIPSKDVHFQSKSAKYHEMIQKILDESSIKNSCYLR